MPKHRRCLPTPPDRMDAALARGDARTIQGASDYESHQSPAVLALSPLYQHVWKMHTLGFDGVEIGRAIGREKWDVSRILRHIKICLDYLAGFREQLAADAAAWRSFLGCSGGSCSRCPQCPVKRAVKAKGQELAVCHVCRSVFVRTRRDRILCSVKCGWTLRKRRQRNGETCLTKRS